MFNNETLLFKYNIDESGNPISVKVDNEQKQVSINGTIQMEFIPDEFNRINMLGENNQPMYEVFNRDEITTDTYYVDYSSGTIYYDQSQFGKVKMYNYHSRGFQMIGATRIYDEKSINGELIIKTLQDIIDEGRKCLELIKSLGDAVLIINKLDQDVKTGTVLHENLSSDIEIGTLLDASLKVNIQQGDVLLPELTEVNTIATQKKQALDTSIESAINTNATLSNTNQSATQTNLTLEQTITSGQDSVNKINATGNKSLIIGASQFINNEYTWLHSMNNDNLIVNFMDSVTNEPLMPNYKIIDKNNIIIRNNIEHPNVKVVLSASYYQGNALFGTNVEEFVNDSITVGAKKVRLKDGNGVVENPITDSDAVFMSDGTTKLTKKISDIDALLVDILHQNLVADIKSKKYNIGDKIFSKLHGGSWWEIKTEVKLSGWAIDWDDELHIQVQLKDNTQAVAECQISSVIDYAKTINTQKSNEFYTKINDGRDVTIACYGDSITYGQDTRTGATENKTDTNFGDGSIHQYNHVLTPYPKHLENCLKEVYRNIVNLSVINRGYSGDTIGQGYVRHKNYSSNIMSTIFYGINDGSNCTNQGANLENMYDPNNMWNISDFISFYRKFAIREMLRGSGVIFITPHRYNYGSSKAVKYYARAVMKLANELNVLCISMDEFIGDYYNNQVTYDTCHLNDFGVEVVGKRLASVFIGYGYESAERIFGERQITVSRLKDTIVTQWDNVSNRVTFSPPYFNDIDGENYLVRTTDSLYFSFFLEEDTKIFMPVGYINDGKLKYEIDFGIEQPQFKLDFNSTYTMPNIDGQLTPTSEKPNSVKIIDGTNVSLTFINSLDDIPSHLCIQGKGWHSIKFSLVSGSQFVMSGIRFVNFNDSLVIDKV